MSKIEQIKLFAQTVQEWEENFSDYPSSEYSLKIYLKNKDNPKITLTGVVQTDDTFLFATKITDITESGTYIFQTIATKSGVDYPVDDGVKYIHASLANDGDDRSDWHIIHDYLVDAYTEMVKDKRLATQVSINGRSTTYDRAQLLKEITNAARRAGLSLDGMGQSKKVNKILARF